MKPEIHISVGENRDLSELKVHYQFLVHVVAFVGIVGGCWLGLGLLAVAAMILGVDIHQPLGQSAKLMFVLAALVMAVGGLYLGMKTVNFLLVVMFALLGQIKWAAFIKTIRNFDFPEQWLKTPLKGSDLAPSKKC